MISLMLRLLIDFLWQRKSESSSVRLRQDGSMSPVTPFEVQEEAIQDLTDEIVPILMYGGILE